MSVALEAFLMKQTYSGYGNSPHGSGAFKSDASTAFADKIANMQQEWSDYLNSTRLEESIPEADRPPITGYLDDYLILRLRRFQSLNIEVGKVNDPISTGLYLQFIAGARAIGIRTGVSVDEMPIKRPGLVGEALNAAMALYDRVDFKGERKYRPIDYIYGNTRVRDGFARAVLTATEEQSTQIIDALFAGVTGFYLFEDEDNVGSFFFSLRDEAEKLGRFDVSVSILNLFAEKLSDGSIGDITPFPIDTVFNTIKGLILQRPSLNYLIRLKKDGVLPQYLKAVAELHRKVTHPKGAFMLCLTAEEKKIGENILWTELAVFTDPKAGVYDKACALQDLIVHAGDFDGGYNEVLFDGLLSWYIARLQKFEDDTAGFPDLTGRGVSEATVETVRKARDLFTKREVLTQIPPPVNDRIINLIVRRLIPYLREDEERSEHEILIRLVDLRTDFLLHDLSFKWGDGQARMENIVDKLGQLSEDDLRIAVLVYCLNSGVGLDLDRDFSTADTLKLYKDE